MANYQTNWAGTPPPVVVRSHGPPDGHPSQGLVETPRLTVETETGWSRLFQVNGVS